MYRLSESDIKGFLIALQRDISLANNQQYRPVLTVIIFSENSKLDITCSPFFLLTLSHAMHHSFNFSIQKYKSIASPKTPQNRAKGKQKPTGLRVRRVNQI